MLSKNEWDNWLLDPTTQVVREFLARKVKGIQDQWLSGALTSETEFGTKFLNARALGAAQSFQDILNLDEVIINGDMYESDTPNPAPEPATWISQVDIYE